jgi:hypothetical protein
VIVESVDGRERRARSLFGIVVNPTLCDIERIRSWAEDNSYTRMRVVVCLLPGCVTAGRALLDLDRYMFAHSSSSLLVRIHVSSTGSLRWRPFLCMVQQGTNEACFGSLPCEGMGPPATITLTPAPSLVAALEADFRECWAEALNMDLPEVRDVAVGFLRNYEQPLADGWQGFSESLTAAAVQSKAPFGDRSEAQADDPLLYMQAPSDDLVPERLAALYRKGALLAVDRQSQLLPFDFPVGPKMLAGVPRPQQAGRNPRANARVSIFTSEELESFERFRHALRALLAKYAFPVERDLRWMPHAVRQRFEDDWCQVGAERESLLRKLIPTRSQILPFFEGRREKLTADLEAACHSVFGKRAVVDPNASCRVMKVLGKRVEKAFGTQTAPPVAYFPTGFTPTEEADSPSWKQARRLLTGIARRSRRPILPVGVQSLPMSEGDDEPSDTVELAKAMCVQGDPWLGTRTRVGSRRHCERELQHVDEITECEDSERRKCERLLHLLDTPDQRTYEDAVFRLFEPIRLGNSGR